MSSMAVSTSIPRLCLCGGIPLCRRLIFCQSLPTRISLRPDFSLCGPQRRSIRLIPSIRPPSLRASIWMQFRWITVISVDSSNGDPDSSEDHSSTGSSPVPGSPTSSSTSGCVVVSPSHYPTPEEPVVLLAASSVLIYPNRVREDCFLVTAEVYLVFEVSPDTTGC